MKGHTMVSQYRSQSRLSVEKNVSEYALRDIPTQTQIFLSYFLQIYKFVEKTQKTSLKITHHHVLCAGECFVTVL